MLPRETEEWLKFAESDVKAAHIMLQHREYHQVAYHAQQAAEKALKSVLCALHTSPDTIHDLIRLVRSLEPHGIFAERRIKDLCFTISAYCTTARYPGFAEITPERGQEAYQGALEICQWVGKILKEIEKKAV